MNESVIYEVREIKTADGKQYTEFLKKEKQV